MPKKWLVNPELLEGHTGPGTNDPMYQVDIPIQEDQPVLVAFIVSATPIVATFTLQILTEAEVETPLWIRTTLTGIGGLLLALSALWARARVTPLSNPKDDDGDPLVPVIVQRGRKVG